jgi:hypothetical protein
MALSAEPGNPSPWKGNPYMASGYIWGEAEVTYPDLQGTAQLDERKTGRQIEEIVGLDSDEWLVVGLDIGGGEHSHDLKVIAVKQELVPTNIHDFAESNGGEIPVTEFLIHDVDPYAVLKEITHMFELRLRVRGSVGHTIRVVAKGDVPEQ